MPSITAIHESLPYIDTEPTPAERQAAEALITAERATVSDDPHHALLPQPYQPQYTPAFQAEIDRIASSSHPNKPYDSQTYKPTNPLKKAIDLTRYEASSDTTLPANATSAELEASLRQAYISSTYLAGRRKHLDLMEAYGKNAWLVGNWQLDHELKALEKELADRKREIDLVTLRRQQMQQGVAGEMGSLNETWRKGVGRVLETEVAAEGLRREVLEARRRREQGVEVA